MVGLVVDGHMLLKILQYQYMIDSLLKDIIASVHHMYDGLYTKLN